MRKGTTLIWMNDFGLYHQCRLEAQKRGMATISDLVAQFVQQELGTATEYKTPEALYIDCQKYIQSHNNTNIAGFMEYCCRKGLGQSAEAQPDVVQTIGVEQKKRGSVFDLNRDAR